MGCSAIPVLLGISFVHYLGQPFARNQDLRLDSGHERKEFGAFLWRIKNFEELTLSLHLILPKFQHKGSHAVSKNAKNSLKNH